MKLQTDYDNQREKCEKGAMWFILLGLIVILIFSLDVTAQKTDYDKSVHEVESYVQWFTRCVNKKKQARALAYAPIVVTESLRGHVDPLLLSVLISLEASWNPASEGAQGEIGLTQIMPGGICDPGKLDTPKQQIAAGVDCLVKCREKCGDNIEKILTKYASGNCSSKSETTKRKMKYRLRMYKQAVERHRK